MTEEKIKGIVLKLIDYKEADKLASIFSFDYGVVLAKFRGVKREKAKLKSVAQPFTFADFNIVKTGEHRTVVSADTIDNFPKIMQNYDKTICGYIVLDIIKSILMEAKSEPEIFLLTVNALKNIEDGNHFVATIDFILKFMTFQGVGLTLNKLDYVYLDINSGNFTSDHSAGDIQIDKKVYLTLCNIATGTDFENNESILRKILRLLHNIILIKFDEDIRSFQFI